MYLHAHMYIYIKMITYVYIPLIYIIYKLYIERQSNRAQMIKQMEYNHNRHIWAKSLQMFFALFLFFLQVIHMF